jgi:hypothetical protein
VCGRALPEHSAVILDRAFSSYPPMKAGDRCAELTDTRWALAGAHPHGWLTGGSALYYPWIHLALCSPVFRLDRDEVRRMTPAPADLFCVGVKQSI